MFLRVETGAHQIVDLQERPSVDGGRTGAPRVVLKGVQHMKAEIVDIAERISIVPRPCRRRRGARRARGMRLRLRPATSRPGGAPRLMYVHEESPSTCVRGSRSTAGSAPSYRGR
jgi:hypothetical protein